MGRVISLHQLGDGPLLGRRFQKRRSPTERKKERKKERKRGTSSTAKRSNDRLIAINRAVDGGRTLRWRTLAERVSLSLFRCVSLVSKLFGPKKKTNKQTKRTCAGFGIPWPKETLSSSLGQGEAGAGTK